MSSVIDRLRPFYVREFSCLLFLKGGGKLERDMRTLRVWLYVRIPARACACMLFARLTDYVCALRNWCVHAFFACAPCL